MRFFRQLEKLPEKSGKARSTRAEPQGTARKKIIIPALGVHCGIS